jgi:hypothetical protein
MNNFFSLAPSFSGAVVRSRAHCRLDDAFHRPPVMAAITSGVPTPRIQRAVAQRLTVVTLIGTPWSHNSRHSCVPFRHSSSPSDCVRQDGVNWEMAISTAHQVVVSAAMPVMVFNVK